ncbi:hypothetical protein H2200_012982 [Cladophialophora chaetospira]|uniref:Velvet domain-containing protein n=1 Tax=Cladophialophora chaetospira TaxID=386627 RepID=A0AA38WWI0_9EURO|nr:hypothetical protein H2200_012982 [Cladophialophora chaetospira]
MDSSRQHNFAPSRAPLYHNQHPPVAPPPLHIPHPAAYSVGQAMANNNIYPMTANGTHPMDGNNISPMAGPSMIPPSPSQASSVEDMSNYELPDIAPMSRKWGKYAFGLKIVQHPHRARMCGFGDKDRRPITPPLIVQLLIIDPATETEFDYEKTIDWQKLVCHVALWDVNGNADTSILKPDQSSAHISTTSLAPYPQIVRPMTTRQIVHPYDITKTPAWQRDVLGPPPSPQSYSSGSHHDQNGHYDNGYDGHNGLQQHTMAQGPAATPLAQAPAPQEMGFPGQSKVEPTRNLIGSMHSSLQKLEGLDGKIGLFFIFQDMSVRTEGWFRLKCSLFALGKLGLDGEEQGAEQGPVAGLLLECPRLASTFTKPFKVFSAKKFPGVGKTTAWSEKFANQGIKIPIRKNDAKGKGKKRSHDDSDEEDEED